MIWIRNTEKRGIFLEDSLEWKRMKEPNRWKRKWEEMIMKRGKPMEREKRMNTKERKNWKEGKRRKRKKENENQEMND